MGAVGKAALTGQRGDVGKRLFDPAAGAQHAQFAHAGHVDQQRPVRQEDQVAPRGGVAALPGVSDLRVCRLPLPSSRLISVVLPTPDEPSRQ